VAISDADLARIRATASYRAALWVARFNFLPLVAWFWMVFGWRSAPGAVVFGVWFLLAAGIVGGLFLLRRAGVPFARRFLSWRVEDNRMQRRFYRDVFWFRRT